MQSSVRQPRGRVLRCPWVVLDGAASCWVHVVPPSLPSQHHSWVLAQLLCPGSGQGLGRGVVGDESHQQGAQQQEVEVERGSC